MNNAGWHSPRNSIFRSSGQRSHRATVIPCGAMSEIDLPRAARAAEAAADAARREILPRFRSVTTQT